MDVYELNFHKDNSLVNGKKSVLYADLKDAVEGAVCYIEEVRSEFEQMKDSFEKSNKDRGVVVFSEFEIRSDSKERISQKAKNLATVTSFVVANISFSYRRIDDRTGRMVTRIRQANVTLTGRELIEKEKS